MQNHLLDELGDLISRHIVQSGAPLRPLPNLILGCETGPTPPCFYVADPVFSLIVQGRKRIEAGEQNFVYGPGQGMIVSVEMPMSAYVIEASATRPFLGVGLRLQPQTIASLLLEHPAGHARNPRRAAITTSDLAEALLDAVVRLLRLLDTPADIPVLAPAIEREILWRLLNTPQGDALSQIGLADSHATRISRVLRWLRAHFAEPIRISRLAEIAGMSETSFHRHFRIITTMTPIQYQKQLRLHAARARMIASAEEVAQIAYEVGYESPSQFSREYKRMYGASPATDGRALRSGSPTSHPPP